MPMGRTVRALLGGTLVPVVALIAACASNGASSERIEVKAREFSFDPAVVTVSAGKQYQLVLQNKGAVLHDWTVERIPTRSVAAKASAAHDMAGTGGMAGSDQLHAAAGAGKTSAVLFTPMQPGEYEYTCMVPGHREAGMRGRLIVRE